MDTKKITLRKGLTLNGEAVTEVTIRRPNTGELRGIKLMDVLQLDVSELMKLLSRIMVPFANESDLADLDPADLTALGVGVIDFFTPSDAPSPTK